MRRTIHSMATKLQEFPLADNTETTIEFAYTLKNKCYAHANYTIGIGVCMLDRKYLYWCTPFR